MKFLGANLLLSLGLFTYKVLLLKDLQSTYYLFEIIHVLNDRTPEGKAALSKRKSKEDPDWIPEGGMVTGRVTGSRVKVI